MSKTPRNATSESRATTSILKSVVLWPGVRPGSVRVIPDAKRADRFTMRVIEKIRTPSRIVARETDTSITRPAELGVSESGLPVQVLFLRRHALIGGTPSREIRHRQYHPRLPGGVPRRGYLGRGR